MSTSDESGRDSASPATGDDVQYEFRSVRTIRGREASTIAKWRTQGWELDTQSQGTLRTELTFRRVKAKTLGTYLSGLAGRASEALRGLEPKKQRRLLVGSGSLLLLLIVAAIATGVITEDEDPEPTATAVAPTEPPSETSLPETTEAPQRDPEPSDEAEPKPATRAQVVDAFQSYIDERAASGVMVAQAVTDLSFNKRIVRVTFDPAAAGVDQAIFDQLKGFDNLAQFVSTPIAFNDDLGTSLRPAIDSIETVHANGTPLGTLTTAEIIRMNGLDGAAPSAPPSGPVDEEPESSSEPGLAFCPDELEALGPFVQGVDPLYDPSMDWDGDGVSCE